MNYDLINATFEIGGAIAASQNVILTYKAKEVKGVSMIATFWFSSWGFWNVLYYQSLGQTLSNYAAAVIATINLIWLCQIWYYNKLNKELKHGEKN